MICHNPTSLRGECPMMFHSCGEWGGTECLHAPKETTPMPEMKITIAYADGVGPPRSQTFTLDEGTVAALTAPRVPHHESRAEATQRITDYLMTRPPALELHMQVGAVLDAMWVCGFEVAHHDVYGKAQQEAYARGRTDATRDIAKAVTKLLDASSVGELTRVLEKGLAGK